MLVGHRRAGSWRLLVAEAATPDGRKARVLEAVDAGTDPSGAFEQLTEKHRPDSTIGVLASGEAVSRTVEIPEGHDGELSSAASLLAEAELPPSIPAHRKVGGLIPLPATPGFRSALLLGWAQREGAGVEPSPGWDAWTSEIVGLAELLLLARVGGASGPRVVASVDREWGCIGVVGAGTDSHTVRAVLEDPSEPESFNAAADRFAEAAARKVGATPETLADSGGVLIDPETRSAITGSVSGSQDDPKWFGSFAVALGVACAALRATPASSALFELRPTPPNIERALAERVLLGLRDPKTAAVLIAAGLALALLLPIVFSSVRLSMLESRLAGVQEALGVDADPESDQPQLTLQQQIAIYSELDRNRWPMAKLLADLAAALPADSSDQLTLVRQIDVSFPDGVSVTGVADSVGLVTRAKQSLDSSVTFSGAQIDRIQQAEGDNNLIEFELNSRVSRPFFTARIDSDYAEENLAERLYDEEGAEIWRRGAPVVTALNRSGSGGPRSSARSSGARSVSRGPAASGAGGDSSGSASEVASAREADSDARTERREMFQGGSRSDDGEEQKPIPEALTEAEIAELNQQEAMREMVARRSASRRDDIGDDVKRRLEEESAKLRARALEAQREGG